MLNRSLGILPHVTEPLPVSGAVVLEKLPPDVNAGVEAGDDRIDDPRRAVDDIEGRMEPVLRRLSRRDLFRGLVSDPAGVDTVPVTTVGDVIRRRSARHHVERGLGPVRVRMSYRLVGAEELSPAGRHVQA